VTRDSSIVGANPSWRSALLKIKKCTEKALFSPKALGSKKKINIMRKYEA
jgi:hypothetical protein